MATLDYPVHATVSAVWHPFRGCHLLQANANDMCFKSFVTLYCTKMMRNLGRSSLATAESHRVVDMPALEHWNAAGPLRRSPVNSTLRSLNLTTPCHSPYLPTPAPGAWPNEQKAFSAGETVAALYRRSLNLPLELGPRLSQLRNKYCIV